MRECACSRITNNYICKTCTAELAGYLHRTPWLISELETTAARLDKTSSGGNTESKTASKSRPDTVNLNATLAAQELLFLTFKFGGDAGRAALHPDGPAHYARFRSAYQHGVRIIDIKARRLRLGECPTPDCKETLRPIWDEETYKCLGCEEQFIVQDVVLSKIQQARDPKCRIAEAPDILAGLGFQVTLKAVEHWVAKKKLEKAEEVDGIKYYRVIDFFRVAKAVKATRSRRTGATPA